MAKYFREKKDQKKNFFDEKKNYANIFNLIRKHNKRRLFSVQDNNESSKSNFLKKK